MILNPQLHQDFHDWLIQPHALVDGTLGTIWAQEGADVLHLHPFHLGCLHWMWWYTHRDGMKNSLLFSTVNGSHYRESARKYQGRTASLANGEVWTNSCKNVLFFAASMPATVWSITGKIILTALLPYSLITAHPARMGVQ